MSQTKAELLQTKHQGELRLGDANSSHYVGFKAPATVSSSLVWTLPAADGTANYLLKTDGSGNLAWTADNSGVSLSGSTNNTIATVTGANALQGEANLTFDGSELKLPTGSGTQGLFFQASSGSNANLRGVGTNYGSLGFFFGNSEKVRFDSSGNVGIGTSTPTGIHTAAKVLEISGGDGGDLIIGNNVSTNIGAGAHIGTLAFKNIDDTDSGAVPHYAGIRCEAANTSGSMDLRFYVGRNNLESDAPTMLIDSSGRLLLGTTTEGESGADDLTIATSATTGITIRSGTTSNGNIYFSDGTSGNAEFQGAVQYDHGNSDLYFRSAGLIALTLDSSQNATFA